MISSESYTRGVTDPVGYVVVMNATCRGAEKRECFFGQPQAYDVLQRGFEWNVFALLAVFEWLSASYALFYLQDTLWVGSKKFKNVVNTSCLIWNVAGIFLFMPYSFPLSLLQTGLSGIAIAFTIAMQSVGEVRSGLELDRSRESEEEELRRSEGEGSGDAAHGVVYAQIMDKPPRPEDVIYCYPSAQTDIEFDEVVEEKVVSDGNFQWKLPKTKWRTTPSQGQNKASASVSRITQHYSEYCASASFLLLAVLTLFVADPNAWASIVGFTGILLCNLTGIAAHHCKVDQHRRAPTNIFSLDWTKEGNHFKLFMLHSWSALLLSVGIIFYLGKQDLINSNIPGWVLFILWNLLVTYTLFGFWATICYAMAGTRADGAHFNVWMGRLDYGLTILSVAAKLPIAFTVYYGISNKPGGMAC